MKGKIKTYAPLKIILESCLLCLFFVFNMFCFDCKFFSDNVSNNNINACVTSKVLLSLDLTKKPNSKQLYLDASNKGNSSSDVEKELDENIEKQLREIDFENLDKIVQNMDDENLELIKNKSFLDLVKGFLNAENGDLYSNFLTYALALIFNNVLAYVPLLAMIVAIAIVYSLTEQFSSQNKSVGQLLHMVCFCAIAVIMSKIVIDLLSGVGGTINLINSQMEFIFPILLTLITSIGGVVTASVFQAPLAILSTAITKLFSTILIPIFIFGVVFDIVGNISKNVRLEKFSKFFSSLFKWVVGIVFTVFVAFLTIQGLTVSTIDTISFKTAKFAIKSYVPILGSYLSDGISLIMASSVLIKNAVGATGLVLLLSGVFVPLIKIVVVSLLLKLISAIMQPLCDNQISEFVFSVSKSLNLLNVCLIAVGFMYLISVSLIMSCSNLL